MNTLNLNEVTGSAGQIWTAKYSTHFGLSRTVIVRFGVENRYLVYSPGKNLLDQASTIIGQAEEIILVAPSQGHTLGVKSWLNTYPNARLIADTATIAKLIKLGVSAKNAIPLDEASSVFPDHIQLIPVPYCRSGELWLTVQTEERSFWLVCDGVMNIPELSKHLFKALLQKLYGLKLGLWMTPAFLSNIDNKPLFKKWLVNWLHRAPTLVLVPCHGDIYDFPDTNQKIRELVETRC